MTSIYFDAIHAECIVDANRTHTESAFEHLNVQRMTPEYLNEPSATTKGIFTHVDYGSQFKGSISKLAVLAKFMDIVRAREILPRFYSLPVHILSPSLDEYIKDKNEIIGTFINTPGFQNLERSQIEREYDAFLVRSHKWRAQLKSCMKTFDLTDPDLEEKLQQAYDAWQELAPGWLKPIDTLQKSTESEKPEKTGRQKTVRQARTPRS